MNVKSVLKQIEFKAKKRLGQNFLHDEMVLDAILSHADIHPRDTVLEIGAGLGILTEGLSETAGSVISLEVDKVLYEYLETRFKNHKNVHILLQDILKFNPDDLPDQNVKVIANLPYYISTPILTHLMKFIRKFSLILIMLQEELAERITAGPGSKKYGSLSILTRFYTQAEIVAHVPRTAFYPSPGVDSALVRLQVLEQPCIDISDPEGFFRIVRAAFSHRRKTLRNSLLGSGKISAEKLDAAFRATGISPTLRAETLSIHEFAKLAQFLL
ncbi:MAG: 16S rRNA (adenine(1518)-N(6)/adenine(1519)-N(6))-dimethyltransferase RsmA [bacterium]